MTQYMMELACDGCGRTAHITWDKRGPDRKVVNMSDSLKRHPGEPPTFSCSVCDTMQVV